jgi:hypothetical protein
VDEATYLATFLHGINQAGRLEPVGQRALANLNPAIESAARNLGR